MRKNLLGGASAVAIALATTSAAFAADMPVKAAPVPAVPLFNWSGWYVGGHVGGDWGTFLSAGTDAGTFGKAGVVGGGHLGFNVQSGQWVWGLEGDVSGTSLKFTDTATHVRVDLLASVRGRLGIAFDRVLYYGTAGVGWVGGRSTDTTSTHRFSPARPVVGGGIEYAWTNQWLLRAEVLAFLGTSHASTIIPEDTTTKDLRTVYEARVGLTYKFDTWGKGPVVARY